ncbi:hypothetical protein [Alienimonas sp. DA493]|uniref:hypothetical protein n=1 Tax=Alienimonas sp. DA493 TaxID=3373605 RepID=UPI003754C5B1
MTAPAPDPLAALDAAGRRLRRAALTAGLAKTAAVAALATLAVAAADAFGGGFDPKELRAARWVLVGLTAAAALRWLGGPLLRRPDRAALAAAADRLAGGNDRLAAALSSPAAAAGPLRERLLGATAFVPPAPRRGRLRGAVGALLLCGGLMGAWLVADPSAATAAAARLTGTAGLEPLRLEAAGRLVPRGLSEIPLPAGAETTLRAVAPGGRSTGVVRWRVAGATLTPIAPDAVRVPLAAAPVTVAASADGFRSALLTLRPVAAPAVTEYRVVVETPGRRKTTFRSPTAVAVEPTDRVRVEATAAPPAEVRLLTPPGGPEVQRDGDGWRLRRLRPGDWPVGVAVAPRDRPFVSASPDGNGASPRPLFTLRVREDAPPRVALLEPPKDATVTPAGTLILQAEADDDRPGLLVALSARGEVLQTAESGEASKVAATAEFSPAANLLPGDAFIVFAAAIDARNQRTNTPPRTVRVVSPEEKRDELEAAVPPPAAALQGAAAAAAELATRIAEGAPVDPAEVRRTLERLEADFAAPVRTAAAEAARNAVSPGPRLTAAGREEREALPAIGAAADRLRAALRTGEAEAAAAQWSERLAASAGRLADALAAAEGAETAGALREEQRGLTDRTAAAARDGGGDAAGLAEEQREIADALGALRDGPAAEALRTAARELSAGRLADAVARQREALARWEEAAGAAGSPADPSERGEALSALAARQRAAATGLRAVADEGLTGRRALRALREVGEEETAVADALAAFAPTADAVTAAAAGASAAEARTVAEGVEARRDAAELLPLAERAAARLEALAGSPDGSSQDDSPPDGAEEETPQDEAAEGIDAAALARWQRFLRERTLGDAPDLPALAAEQRALAAALPAEAPAAEPATEAAARLADGAPAAAAERQQAALDLLAERGAAALSAASTPEPSPGPPPASPTGPEPGTLPDAGTEDAAAPGVAGGGAGAGGSSGTGGASGLVVDGTHVPWGRLPARLRERLKDAADAPAAPGFAELTARYRARLGEAADSPPSPPPASPSASPPSNALP